MWLYGIFFVLYLVINKVLFLLDEMDFIKYIWNLKKCNY